MKVITGKKGKKNKVYALNVKIIDRHAVPSQSKQFSIAGSPSLEDAFEVVLAGTRKEIERRKKSRNS